MSNLQINGGFPLEGEVKISGSKNAALCLIAGALAIQKKVILQNIPVLTDIYNFIEILKALNVKCVFIDDNHLLIDSRNIVYKSLCLDEVQKFRASYYLIGALLPSVNHVEINYPGGCNFSKRPIDIHLKMFEDYGCKYIANDCLNFHFEEYKNHHIVLKNISFGATVNAILMGLYAKEEVVIENVSKECEIDCLISFLNTAGKNIARENNKIIIKEGSFHNLSFSNIPDRMEIGTFAFLAASKGKLKLYPIIREQISYLEDVFQKLNITYYFVENSLVIENTNVNKSLIIETGEYPLFPTDLQPILTAYLTTIRRIHVLKENVYNERFSHVEELKKMGAVIFKESNTLLINGIFSLHGSIVKAKDLRCGAALLVCALNAEGKTIIENAEILYRGYESIVKKLKAIGAQVEVIE